MAEARLPTTPFNPKTLKEIFDLQKIKINEVALQKIANNAAIIFNAITPAEIPWNGKALYKQRALSIALLNHYYKQQLKQKKKNVEKLNLVKKLIDALIDPANFATPQTALIDDITTAKAIHDPELRKIYSVIYCNAFKKPVKLSELKEEVKEIVADSTALFLSRMSNERKTKKLESTDICQNISDLYAIGEVIPADNLYAEKYAAQASNKNFDQEAFEQDHPSSLFPVRKGEMTVKLYSNAYDDYKTQDKGAFSDLYNDIKEAKDSIIIAAWSFDGNLPMGPIDPKGGERSNLLKELVAAANRDVDVVILAWDNSTDDDLKNTVKTLKALAKDNPKLAEHITVKVSKRGVGYTDHQKMAIVDSQKLYIGGLDLAKDRDAEWWHDCHAAISGPAVVDAIELLEGRWLAISEENISFPDKTKSQSDRAVENVFTAAKKSALRKPAEDEKKLPSAQSTHLDLTVMSPGTPSQVSLSSPALSSGRESPSTLNLSDTDSQSSVSEVKKRDSSVDDFSDLKIIIDKVSSPTKSGELTPDTTPGSRTSLSSTSSNLSESSRSLSVSSNSRSESPIPVDRKSELKIEVKTEVKADLKVAIADKKNEVKTEPTVQLLCSLKRKHFGSSKWPGNVGHVSEIQKGYLDVINHAKKFIYMENQYFSGPRYKNKKDELGSNAVIKAIADKIIAQYRAKKDFHFYCQLPFIPIGGREVPDIYRKTWKGIKWFIDYINKHTEGQAQKYVTFYNLGHVENDKFVQKYTHSKLLMADDNELLIGSANCNERSMKGDRDSEVCLHLRGQTEQIQNYRERLMLEHFGQDARKYFADPHLTKNVEGLQDVLNTNLHIVNENKDFADTKATPWGNIEQAKLSNGEKPPQVPEETSRIVGAASKTSDKIRNLLY